MSSTPNVVQAWLEMIGTVERAQRLQAAFAGTWTGCPSAAMFGQAGSEILYANPRYRAALDSWDTGLTTRRDIMCWAEHVASGAYKGPAYFRMVIPLPPREPASLPAA
jgi:hypothetical protein